MDFSNLNFLEWSMIDINFTNDFFCDLKCCQLSKYYMSQSFKNIVQTHCEIKVYTKICLKFIIHYFVIFFSWLKNFIC